MAVDSKPVTHTTAWRIRQYIITKGLEAGDKLPSQRNLAAALGVSRNSLREALATLIFMGVVRVLPGRGAYVAHATPRHCIPSSNPDVAAQRFSQAEIYQLRFALEAQTATLAAGRAMANDIQALRTANARMADCLNDRQLTEAAQYDFELHTMIADIAGNAVIRDVLTRYQSLVQESQALPLYALSRLSEAVTEHDLLIDAIEAADPLRAQHMVRHHLLQAGSRTGSTFPIS